MVRDSSKKASWSDTDLTRAVTVSRSWRGVMRELGLCVTSAGSLRVVKRRVTELGLDTAHFTGQRPWSDPALKRAAAQAHSWNELFDAIGMESNSGDARLRIKAHALRLGLDLSHLTNASQVPRRRTGGQANLRNLREAATPLAATWFSLCGFNPLSRWSLRFTTCWYQCRMASSGYRSRRPRIAARTAGKLWWAEDLIRRAGGPFVAELFRLHRR
jgi:hypothetical protein